MYTHITRTASLSIKRAAVGDRSQYIIEWNDHPVRTATYNALAGWFSASRDYAPTSAQKLRVIQRLVNKVNVEHQDTISVDQALAVRNICIKNKIIKKHQKINALAPLIREQYESGENVLALSVRYDYPPLGILRNILPAKYPRALDVFAGRASAVDILRGRDLEQYALAETNDAEAALDQQRAAQVAADNEFAFVNYFIQLGIRLRTQNDLAKSQTLEHGHAISTPDLVFEDEVVINGNRIIWIDYKDYIGTATPFLAKSNAAQAKKYEARWGPGALCYHRSYVDNLVIPHAMLLDARALPINYLE